ncbi:MAG: biotin/lipoyl-binding protein [Candidatus Delongbacteria bacterium]|nr:biotin/lipoyl-binding protein [Candidatus Delongbacteria bacterium]MCG2760070.1 biotin/lipoyl-binding protein [Candidatus Delongbacteria bacterium]
MKELKLEISGKEYTVGIEEFDSLEAVLTVNGKKYIVGLKDLGEELKIETVQKAGSSQQTAPSVQSVPQTTAVSPSTGSSEVLAPLPGLILNVLVKAGDPVKSGQKIIIMEAMKMENDINAVKNGIIKAINVKNGDNISEGDVLAVIE